MADGESAADDGPLSHLPQPLLDLLIISMPLCVSVPPRSYRRCTIYPGESNPEMVKKDGAR